MLAYKEFHINKLILNIFCLLFLINTNIYAQWTHTQCPSGILITKENDVYCGTQWGVRLPSGNNIIAESINNGLPNIHSYTAVNAIIANNNSIFVSVFDTVYLSTNNGAQWYTANNGLSGTIISLAANDDKIFACNNDLDIDSSLGRVFLSTDNGSNWYKVNNGIIDNEIVTSLLINGNNVFIGTHNGAFVSSDDGLSWKAVKSGMMIYGGINALTAIGDTIIAGTNYGVFILTEKDSSWIAANTGLPEIKSIYSLATYGNTIFAGSSYDVFLSTNRGLSWISFTEGLVDLRINSLTRNNTYIFAATDRDGVWRRPLSEVITQVENNHNCKPIFFLLEQNYPNPFNPTTKITFTIPNLEPSFVNSVKLRIYDFLGREIATLVDGIKSPGEHSVEWNAKGLSSGIYFYRLQAGLYTDTKKLVLLK
ncbi:MAG: T9SS type A sorting domain-containing protein [Bacteroidetes bacterium]|nr:T9SS type A sorting domain-containing protein [Bacteroidota bacterium]